MPVLTTPFAAIPSSLIAQKLIQYPATHTLSTELTIQPVAGETWATEGLSFSFTIKYLQQYYVNVQGSNEALVASKKSLKESQKYLEAALKHTEEELTALKGAFEQAKKEYEKEPTFPNGVAVDQAEAAVRGGEASVQNVKHEQEGVLHEIEIINKEIAELGRTVALEYLKTPALKITARLYARGNELVWNQQLSGMQFLIPKGFTRSGEYSTAFGEIIESFNTHIQYDDPIDITERENLKLSFEFVGPPAVTGHEGPEALQPTLAGEGELSEITAIVNYSH